MNKKLEDCKLEAKIQNEKNLEQIKALEERIESLENTEKDNEFDEVFNEYENNKVKLQKQGDNLGDDEIVYDNLNAANLLIKNYVKNQLKKFIIIM